MSIEKRLSELEERLAGLDERNAPPTLETIKNDDGSETLVWRESQGVGRPRRAIVVKVLAAGISMDDL